MCILKSSSFPENVLIFYIMCVCLCESILLWQPYTSFINKSCHTFKTTWMLFKCTLCLCVCVSLLLLLFILNCLCHINIFFKFSLINVCVSIFFCTRRLLYVSLYGFLVIFKPIDFLCIHLFLWDMFFMQFSLQKCNNLTSLAWFLLY